jgi:uncharacterized protein YndB with AHSA1/START domain
MAALVSPLQGSSALVRKWQDELAGESGWIIAKAVTLNADAGRISRALTLPEYIEAWICSPDLESGSRVVASSTGNGYRLEFGSPGRVSASVTASYLSRHRRKMRLTWRKKAKATLFESVVDLRLQGNFGSSILKVRHSALASMNEFMWHQQMWVLSLDRLASLMRSA